MTSKTVKLNAINNLFKESQTLKYTMTLGLILGLGTVPAYADIYKITKADGSVIYSDRAANDMNSKVEIVNIPTAATSSSQNRHTYTAPSSPVNTNNERKLDSNAVNNNSPVNYTLKILSPIKERAYHRPAQNIEVEVNVTPRLRAGDKVSILIDGTEVATGLTASVPTTQLNPGKHILEVNVLTSSGISTSLQTMTFYVIQSSRVMQQKRQLAEQLNAYNKLPWYKKAIVKLSSK